MSGTQECGGGWQKTKNRDGIYWRFLDGVRLTALARKHRNTSLLKERDNCSQIKTKTGENEERRLFLDKGRNEVEPLKEDYH
jgi:hypothetical protein